MNKPREYQTSAIDAGHVFFKTENTQPALMVLPTAWGKSYLIAYIVKDINDKVLIISPSRELLEQNYSKYTLLGGKASIYSASLGQKKISDVTYATIGSIVKLGAQFKEQGFTKMIIDEAHLFPRESSGMLSKFIASSGITHVLGLTATPLKLQTNRDLEGNNYSKLVMLTSRSKKGQFFKDMIHVSQVSEMVELGFWAKLEYEQYNLEDDGKLVFNSSKADYTEASLNAVYESNDTNNKIIQKIADMPNRKSIIVFVPSVANAIALSRQIPSSIAVYADMGNKERENAISFFKKGAIRVVINVNVLACGFDHPELDTIICARPTASLAWFYQALGRGTRIHPNKKDCLIVDFSGNVKKFGRIEKLVFVKENIWKLYGEGGNLLTGIPLHTIGEHTAETEAAPKKVIMPFGKHQGKEIKDIDPNYRSWMLQNFTWNDRTMKIKKEIERLKAA